MAIVHSDWEIDRTTKNITYTGGDHGAGPSYATVIQFHRWLQGLADDAIATAANVDELDITNTNPSQRSTDNIITLINGYNINDNAAEHLYDGSIIQDSGDTIYDGIVNFGNSDVQIQIIQDGVVLADDWWNQSGAGLNPDANQGISHRFMLKVRTNGVDIDGRRIIGTSRRLNDAVGNTFSEFKINGTARGNNVLALTDTDDLNNANTATTIGGWTGITSIEGLRSIDVDGNGTPEQYYVEWDINFPTRTINDFYERMKYLSRDGSASTIAGLNGELFRGITHSFGFDGETTPDFIAANDQLSWGTYVSHGAVTGGPFQVGEAVHEDTATPAWKGRVISVDGTDTSLVVDITSGTVGSGEGFTGQTSGATATTDAIATVVTGGGLLHVIATDNTNDVLYVQVLKGTAPADNAILYDCGAALPGSADHTEYCAVANEVNTITERALSTPFVGASTGSAIIGGYGLGIGSVPTDLTSSDKLTDLTGTVNSPPNNVTNTVSGLLHGEDRVLVAPWDGSSEDTNGDPAIQKDQLSLSTPLNANDEASVVVSEGIPTDTPSSGFIRVTDDDGYEKRIKYSSWDTSTFTIDTTYHTNQADSQNDFGGVTGSGTYQASTANDVYIAYLDELAQGSDVDVDVDNLVSGTTYVINVAGTSDFTSVGAADNNPGTIFTATGAYSTGTGTAYTYAATASFASVQNGTRNLVVIVRDGGTTPIKQFISSWRQTSSPATLNAIRTTDT